MPLILISNARLSYNGINIPFLNWLLILDIKKDWNISIICLVIYELTQIIPKNLPHLILFPTVLVCTLLIHLLSVLGLLRESDWRDKYAKITRDWVHVYNVIDYNLFSNSIHMQDWKLSNLLSEVLGKFADYVMHNLS